MAPGLLAGALAGAELAPGARARPRGGEADLLASHPPAEPLAARWHPSSASRAAVSSSFLHCGGYDGSARPPLPEICYHYPGEDPNLKVWKPPKPDSGLHTADTQGVLKDQRWARRLEIAEYCLEGVVAGGMTVAAGVFGKRVMEAKRQWGELQALRAERQEQEAAAAAQQQAAGEQEESGSRESF